MDVASANSYAGITTAFSFVSCATTTIFISSRGNPLTEEEKTYLKQFYPARLVDGVRVVEELASSGAFIHTADATTYGNNLIVINKRRAARRTLKLLKHEFVHICQYDVLGIDGFAREYTNGYVDGGYEYGNIPMEQDAFDYQGLDDATTPIVSPTFQVEDEGT